MIRNFKLIVVGLAATSMLVGCPKDETPEVEEPTEETTEEEAEETEEEAEEEEEEEEEAAEVNKEMYIKAAYEVTCVRAKVDDSETQKEILAEVYPRYGFTAESFTAAEGQLKDETTIQEAVRSRMENCTPEIAAAFKTAGAEAEDAAESDEKTEKDDTKKAAPKGPALAGRYKGSLSGGGIEGGSIEMNVRDDLRVSGKVEGKREGQRFMLPLSGTVAKDGKMRLTAKKGQNNVSISGGINKGVASGQVTGQIHKKALKVNFTLKQ